MPAEGYLTTCECPVCPCQTPVPAQIEDSICFLCRKLEHQMPDPDPDQAPGHYGFFAGLSEAEWLQGMGLGPLELN